MNSTPELTILFQRFGIALVLGLIIGVERESEKSEAFAGIRTFPLISLMGHRHWKRRRNPSSSCRRVRRFFKKQKRGGGIK